MIIILDLHGWRKEIDTWMMREGRIEVGLYPPLSILINDKDKLPSDKAGTINVMFTFYGKKENDIPVFQYEI